MVARLLQLGGCMRRGVRKGERREGLALSLSHFHFNISLSHFHKGERREGVGKPDEKARLGVRSLNLIFSHFKLVSGNQTLKRERDENAG